ncbi:MAG: cobalamin biosynthesis protein [Frankiaceae bacterium]
MPRVDAASLAAGLLLGVLADALAGDPRRAHPVAGFGRAAAALERLAWRDSRTVGAGYVAASLAAPVALAAAAQRATAARPLARTALVAVTTWAVVGGTSLGREARGVAGALTAGDLGESRRRVPALCGRDPASLDHDGVVRAAVESVAENTSDAAVAPLLWGAALGVPGLVGYRVVNTLDAMVGHRSARYERFGWAAARLDDVANYLPARLTAALACALAPVVGGDRRKARDVLRRDGARHPSPNAGRCEAAFAGALDRTLGGRNSYAGRVEDRPSLGTGGPPVVADVGRAVRLLRAVTVAATAICAALAIGLRR